VAVRKCGDAGIERIKWDWSRHGWERVLKCVAIIPQCNLGSFFSCIWHYLDEPGAFEGRRHCYGARTGKRGETGPEKMGQAAPAGGRCG
jgi:hypothetical protein